MPSVCIEEVEFGARRSLLLRFVFEVYCVEFGSLGVVRVVPRIEDGHGKQMMTRSVHHGIYKR
jgi:hypothetical protein